MSYGGGGLSDALSGNGELIANPMANHIVYYKGEGGGFPQVRAVVSLVCPCFLSQPHFGQVWG
jgi:hypothetical protein